MRNISRNITYKEATKSQAATRHGIPNDPNDEQLEAMKMLARKIFEPLREHHGEPIGISSFFRAPVLNTVIGGSTTSQHCKGEAMDIDADICNNGITNKEIFSWIKNNVEFDQLISEFPSTITGEPKWVHVSYKAKGKNRGQVLVSMKKKGGGTTYVPYDE